jgi:hypothetical protein
MSDALGELLATDLGAARCYRCLTGEDEMTLDAIASCYGTTEPQESPEAVLSRVLGVTAEEAASAVSPADTKAEDDAEALWGQWAERIGVAVDATDDGDELAWALW